MPYSPKPKYSNRLSIACIGLMLVAAGCQTSPWSAKNVTGEASILGDKPAAETVATDTEPTSTDPTPQQVMAEVRELGKVNPAAQAALMTELEKADPEIWADVVQNFRSRMAYGDQMYQKEMLAAASQNQATANPSAQNANPQGMPNHGLQYAQGSPYYANQPIPTNAYPSGQQPPQQPTTPMGYPPQTQPYAPQPNNAYPSNAPQGYPAPLPTPNTAPQMAPPGYPYSNAKPTGEGSTDSEILQANYEAPLNEPSPSEKKLRRRKTIDEDRLTLDEEFEDGFDASDKPLELDDELKSLDKRDWNESLAASIEALQKKLDATKEEDRDSPEVKRDQLRLRFLLLAADRSAEAMEPIPGEPEEIADFWAGQMFGLSTMLDKRKTSNPTLRNALAKHKLSESLHHLGKAADLAVRNLAFCKAVNGFASIEQFEQYEFKPGQQVILYAELDNLKYEETVDGYQTSLEIGYKIFDSSDRLIENQQSSASDECSPVLRHDFYVSQLIRLPERLYPGRHILKLTVEDRLGRKYGESVVEFEVK